MYNLDDLLYLMDRLRDPKDGCSWDLKQNLTSINHSTIEEAYELVDALQLAQAEKGLPDQQVQEELGDVLFQVIFYCQLAKESSCFAWEDVVNSLTQKLVRRHPHVFPHGNLKARVAAQEQSSDKIKVEWEVIKQLERSEKKQLGLFDDIPRALPALMRAQKIQKRASQQGFDWPNALSALTKVEEELAELRHAIEFESESRAADELADLLFSCVNVSRHLHIDAELTLERANAKFQRRFNFIEQQLNKKGSTLDQASLAQMDDLWDQAKQSGL